MIRKIAFSAATIAGVAFAHAGLAQSTAPVMDVRPFHHKVTETVPQQVCETRSSGFLGDRTGQIVGGVAGGFLGAEIGSGSGRKAATVAGAVLGAEAGRRHIARPRTECRIVHQMVERDAVAGYDVIYEHDGRLWRTRTTEHPGSSVPVPAARVTRTR